MEVAMRIVRMVKVPIHQIIDVIAMRHGRMAAGGAVHMRRIMPAATVGWRTVSRIRHAHVERVLLDDCARLVMQMAVVQIVGVVIVHESRVTATGAVGVFVVCVCVWHGTVRRR